MPDVTRDAWRSQSSIHEDRERYSVISKGSQKHRDLEFFKNKRILLWTRKPGLGDMVMNAICCDILRRQHGLDVWFGCRFNPYDRDFPNLLVGVPCYKYQPDLRSRPLPNQDAPRGYEDGVDYQGQRHPFDFIIDFRYHMHLEVNTLLQCLEEFGVKKLKLPCNGFPAHNLPEIKKPYDVVLSPDSGGWKPVRAYRRWPELEKLLRERGVSVLNLSKGANQDRMKLAEVLAHVRAAKLYIGVETGPTHLVSGVHQQALIIQAGIHRSAFWNVYANTHVIEAEWPCGGRKCRVRRHEECTIPEGVCIDRFAPRDIADLAMQLIEKK